MLPPGHWLIASIESMLGECLAVQGRHAEAAALLEAAGEALAAALGTSHPATLENAQRLAAVKTPTS